MSWDDKLWYGSSSDYTKYLGTYGKSVTITEAAIDGIYKAYAIYWDWGSIKNIHTKKT